MMKRVYRCPNCGAVKTIDQREADESRVLDGEIPAFIWCMKCPDRHHHYERERIWGEDVAESDRDPSKYNEVGTTGRVIFNRKLRRKLGMKRRKR